MLAWTLLVSALLPLVAAQGSRNLGFEIEAIQAHFNQSHLVPNLFSSFNPRAILDVNFNAAGNISPGQRFNIQQVARSPVLTVQSATQLSGQYTLVMLDADVADSDISAGTNRHWLLYGATVTQESGVSNASATTITPYAGPGPASGSGPHRYVIALYEQPSTFAPPSEFNQTGLPVARMDWNSFVSNSRLGNLVAANYIQVEEGTASAAIPSTAPVDTSTLPPVSAAASATSSAPSNSPTGTSNNTNSALGLSVHVSGVIVMTALTVFFL